MSENPAPERAPEKSGSDRGSARPTYRAAEGMEDRHGEITGAITVNMILTFPPLTIWCLLLAPAVFGNDLRIIIGTGLVLGVVLPILFFRPSRAIWAWISAAFDRWDV